MLYIVATPIGNLSDITQRALEVLKTVDLVLCEDTRRSRILLAHYGIEKPLLVLNDYNEENTLFYIVERLKKGEDIALISDAGTPLINDPGFKLVRECLRQDIKIDFIPGPTSIISALVLSGLPPDKFLFLGYPPAKEQSQKRWLEELFLLINKQKEIAKSLSFTCIILISPHKLLRFLKNMLEVFGDIEVVLAHELTKVHQSVGKKKISVWLSAIKNPKGEYVLLFRI